MNCDKELGIETILRFFDHVLCFFFSLKLSQIRVLCMLLRFRSLSDVCPNSEFKASSLPSDQKKDDSQDSFDVSVRGQGVLEQNSVILPSLWFSMTYVSYGIKKKLIYYVC
jgi:hypothetical protein